MNEDEAEEAELPEMEDITWNIQNQRCRVKESPSSFVWAELIDQRKSKRAD